MAISGFTASECSEEPYFQCRNSKCIPRSLVCDRTGIDNCGDGSDQAAHPPAKCSGQCGWGEPRAGRGRGSAPESRNGQEGWKIWARSCLGHSGAQGSVLDGRTGRWGLYGPLVRQLPAKGCRGGGGQQELRAAP
ncbi:low density lipoprotein receptor class A domain containing 2, partial [Chelydra serpentina]